MPGIPNTTDHTDRPPRLAKFLNLAMFSDLPAWSAAPRGPDAELYSQLREAGFEGVQHGDSAAAHAAGLKHAVGDRLSADTPVADQARRWKDDGSVAATVHAGWGLESDFEIDRIVDEVLAASAKYNFPIYIETHRATLTQDLWRTVQMTARHPDIRFNGDFSHWYTGLEMPYGGLDMKLDFVQPVLNRTAFIHGRIGNSSHMQIDAGRDLAHALTLAHVKDYVQLWTRVMSSWKQAASPGDFLAFAPELLGPSAAYARIFPVPGGAAREETDRWQQSLLYLEIAEHCFASAQAT